MRFDALRQATHPIRRRIATAIYTPPPVPADVATVSFSSFGEDVIVASWLRATGIAMHDIRYLDIGAGEPKRLSNTYLLYLLGASGVLIEPDPDQASALRAARPRDTVVNVGIAFDERRRASLMRMQSRVFNTFLSHQADTVIAASSGWEANPQRVVDSIDVAMIPIDEAIERHCGGATPHFLSVDAEGCDFAIIASLDLTRFCPNVICVEAARPYHEFGDVLAPHGYRLICQTPDNLIFLR